MVRGSEYAGVSITPEELKALKDADGQIYFHNVLDWVLSIMDGLPYFTLLVARIQNYMHMLIKSK